MTFRFNSSIKRLVVQADKYEYPDFIMAAFLAAEKDGIDPTAVKRTFTEIYENVLKRQLGYDE